MELHRAMKETSEPTVDVEKRKVSWGAVVGGLFIAWVSGILASLGALAGSFLLLEEYPRTALGVAVVAVALFYFLAFWLARRRVRDLAMGILIGGCMVALATGACGGLMVMITAGNR